MERQQQLALVRRFASSIAAVTFFVSAPQFAAAELQEIDDAALSAVTGQAVLAFDVTETAESTQTRFTMGSKIDTQINFDQVVLGEYEDPDSPLAADLLVPNMSLGHINRPGEGGGAANQIVPFMAEDPYFEIAEANGELVGFRMGFASAQGKFSGDLQSFSGNIDLAVLDEQGNPHENVVLLDENYNQRSTRATHIGVVIIPPPVEQPEDYEEQPDAPGPPATADPTFPDDPQMAADLAPPPVPELPPRLIVNELSEFKSLDVGNPDPDAAEEMAKDFFFSFQKQDVQWQSNGGGDPITAKAGVHFNIPTNMRLTIPEFQAGVPRARTEFVDRGNGMF